MVSFFLAPVSVQIQKNQQKQIAIVLEESKAEAQSLQAIAFGWNYFFGTQDTEHDYSLGCSLMRGFGGILNCGNSLLYFIWEITAIIARAAGGFLDFFVYYSTNDDSYRGAFVEQGWAVVRDVANLFFIIALLYVAIKTILSMHDAHTKKMVGTIIIVALLINFSLFTTKVVIDASNILAKIFYNNIIPVNDNGVLQTGEEGEKSISVSLIDKYDPQEIISLSVYNGTGGPQIFAFVTLVLLAITIYTAYLFISVALLFVARVVSLWIAMIFSPLAFASNTLPFDIGSLGFSAWLKDLLKNAFLAPLFIFFLYLIILFLNIKDFISYEDNVAPMQKIMSVVIPLLITAGLLMKAKALAVEYSGEMGQNITKIGAAIGGLALGGAALGTAFVGRQALGRGAAWASKGQNAVGYGKERAAFKSDWDKWNQANKEERKKMTKPAASFNEHIQNKKAAAATPAEAAKFDYSLRDRLGGRINAAQIRASKVEHARHDYDEIKKEAGIPEGTSDSNLSGTEKETIKNTFKKKKGSDFESMARKGTDGKDDVTILEKDPVTGNIVNTGLKGESAYKAAKRQSLIDEVHRKGDLKDLDGLELSDQGKKKVEDQLNVALNAAIKITADNLADKKFTTLQQSANEKLSLGEKVGASSTTGSYDIRNIGTKSDKREGLGAKAIIGLTAAVALGIRSGMKTAKIDSGTGKGDILSDLGDTISAALKGSSINLASGGGGGHSKPTGGHAGHDTGGHH